MNQALNQAIETAKSKAAGNAKWMKAIERAAAGLQSGDICVSLLANGYALVTTPTGQHMVNGRCDCDAAKFGHTQCVHRAAKRLVEMAEMATSVSIDTEVKATRADIIADIKARWPVACPGVHLADALMYRFKRNQLEMLSVDFLTAIRAAIA